MENEAWEEALREAFLMAREGLPLRKVLTELQAAGVTRPNGKSLTITTLWRHLNDPAYAGIGMSKRTYNLREPLISKRLFFGVQEKLNAKAPRR